MKFYIYPTGIWPYAIPKTTGPVIEIATLEDLLELVKKEETSLIISERSKGRLNEEYPDIEWEIEIYNGYRE